MALMCSASMRSILYQLARASDIWIFSWLLVVLKNLLLHLGVVSHDFPLAIGDL